MEIRHLKLVKAVAEEGTLTKATDKLFLSQSALSHQLKEIESDVGTPLFHRLNRKLLLTDAGKILFNTAKNVLKELEYSEIELKKSMFDETGKINLCTECYTCYHWLPPILKNYAIKYPNVEVNIQTENISKPLSLLLETKLDLAIIHRKLVSDKIEYTKLFDDELMMVVASDHPLNKKKYIYAKDFESETLLTHSVNFSSSTIFERLLTPEGIYPKKIIYMQITEAIIEMVKSSLGVAVMSKWAMKPYLQNNKISLIPITRKGLWRKWYVATLRKQNKQKYFTDFIDRLKEQPKL